MTIYMTMHDLSKSENQSNIPGTEISFYGKDGEGNIVAHVNCRPLKTPEKVTVVGLEIKPYGDQPLTEEVMTQISDYLMEDAAALYAEVTSW